MATAVHNTSQKKVKKDTKKTSLDKPEEDKTLAELAKDRKQAEKAKHNSRVISKYTLDQISSAVCTLISCFEQEYSWLAGILDSDTMEKVECLIWASKTTF